MQQSVVTIVSVEEGKSGVGQYGPWQAYAIKDAGGNKYDTFKDDHANVARVLIGKSALVGYEIEERVVAGDDGQPRTFKNLRLKSIAEWAGGQPGAVNPQVQQAAVQTAATVTPTIVPAPTPAPAASGGSQAEYRRSKDELRRSEALGHALRLIELGVLPIEIKSFADVDQAVQFVGTYLENGAPEGSSAASSPAPAAGSPDGEPVAFDPETGAPLY